MTKIRQDVNIGGNLRNLRRQNDLKQDDVIAKLHILGCEKITRSTYSRFETGELNIKVSYLRGLKKIFKCSYDDMLDDPKHS